MSLVGWENADVIQAVIPAQQSELTDVPVVVNLSASSGVTGFDMSDIFDKLGANSKKFAIEVGNTGVQCFAEIESWDSVNKKAPLHVKVPSVGTSPTTLNIHYDPAHADNDSYVGDIGSVPGKEVWSNAALMTHQAQDPSGASPQILDSSPHAKHGTSYGSMTSGDLIDGLSGKAIDYDGVDDFTNHGYDAAHDITDKLTIRAVIKPNVTLDSGLTDLRGIVGRQADPADSSDTYGIFINTDGKLQLGSLGGNLQSTKASWAAGETFIIHATYNSTGLVGDLFVDGIREILTSNSLDAMAGSANNLVIGKNNDASEFFPGMIDEVLILNEVWSDDMIALDALSLLDELITFSFPVADSGEAGYRKPTYMLAGFSMPARVNISFAGFPKEGKILLPTHSTFAG